MISKLCDNIMVFREKVKNHYKSVNTRERQENTNGVK